nr:unnamed protein product [Callosobruchus chinensis]
MRRDENVPLSAKSVQHCCEDHFDLETEVENFMRYKLVGGNMKLKSGILPSKFACQHSSKPDNPRPAFEKRQRKKMLEASTSLLRKPVPVQEEYDPLYISEAENITKNKGVQVSKHLKKVDKTCQTKKIKVTSIKPIPSYKEDGAGSKESQESATDSSHPCSSDSSDLGECVDDLGINHVESRLLKVKHNSIHFYLGLSNEMYSLIELLVENVRAPQTHILLVLKKIRLNRGSVRCLYGSPSYFHREKQKSGVAVAKGTAVLSSYLNIDHRL